MAWTRVSVDELKDWRQHGPSQKSLIATRGLIFLSQFSAYFSNDLVMFFHESRDSLDNRLEIEVGEDDHTLHFYVYPGRFKGIEMEMGENIWYEEFPGLMWFTDTFRATVIDKLLVHGYSGLTEGEEDDEP